VSFPPAPEPFRPAAGSYSPEMDARALDLEELRRHTDAVRRLARRILRDDARADDVVQETWLMALRRPPRERARLGAWLGRVARNFALRARRDDKRRRRHEEAQAADPAPAQVPSPAAVLAREETRRRLVAAVLALPAPQRDVVLLRYFEELPPREVARRLDVPVETVRTRLKRALPRLRAHLGEPHERARLLAPLAGAVAMGTKTKLAAAVALVAALLALWSARPAPDRTPAAEERAGAERVGATEARDGDAFTPASDDGAAQDEAPEKASPSMAVRGRVSYDGRPVAGARVVLRDGDGVVAVVRATPEDGTFAFDVEGARVTAAHAVHGPGRAEVENGFAEVVLAGGREGALRVVDADTGRAMPGAEVLLFRSAADGRNAALAAKLEEASGDVFSLLHYAGAFDSVAEVAGAFEGDTELLVPARVTGPDGRVTLGGLLDGAFTAIVRHPDYAVVRARGRTGETTVVRLERGATLTVTTAPHEGAPREGWTCELERPGLVPLLLGRVRLDRRGRAVFPHLRPGPYRVAVSPRGRWHVDLTPRKDGKKGSFSIGMRTDVEVLGPRALRLRADADRTVHLAPAGHAVAGRVEGEAAPGWVLFLLREGRAVREGGAGPDGRFSIAGVPDGAYRLRALSHDGRAAEAEVVVDGADAEVVLAPAPGEVAGLVTGADGRPVAGAVLYALPREHAGRDPKSLMDLLSYLAGQTQSGKDGTFRLRGLPAGELFLFCGHGGALARRELDLDRGEHRHIDLSFAGLHRVVFELERPAHVVVRDRDGGLLSALVVHDALFDPDRKPARRAVFHLPAGRYFVDVVGPGVAPVRLLPLHVRGPEVIRLEPEAGTPVAWKLHDGDAFLRDEPVVVKTVPGGHVVSPGATPFAALLGGRPWRTDAEGRLAIPGLLPGRYELVRDEKSIAVLRVGRRPVDRRVRVTPR